MPKGEQRPGKTKGPKARHYAAIVRTGRYQSDGQPAPKASQKELKTLDANNRGDYKTKSVDFKDVRKTPPLKTADMSKSPIAANKNNSRTRPGTRKTTQKNMTGRRRPGS
jgi:hypothetical protein